MNNFYFAPVFLSLLISCFTLSAGAQGSIIINGGFDRPVSTSYSIDPWIQTGTLLYSAGGCQTADGPNAIGIVSGLLYQDIATTPGQQYLLTFYVAGWGPDGPLSAVHNLAVDWGSQRIGVTAFDSTGRTFQNMGWLQETFEIQAAGTTMRLAFSNPNAISNPNVPMLDAVRLVAVPEPDAWALVGLACISFVARRRWLR
jgi:hypothetical protein